MRRISRRAVLRLFSCVLVLLSMFPVDIHPGSLHSAKGGDGQFSGRQGQVLLVMLPVQGEPLRVVGQFLEREIPFFPAVSQMKDSYAFSGLLGLDMEDKPGAHELRVEVSYPDHQERRSYQVLVMKEKFRVEHITVPKEKDQLDEQAVERYKAEQVQVREVLQAVSADRLWEGVFVEPVRGMATGKFGSLRVINGTPRRPHNGEDIPAPTGTDVKAMNTGVVRLAVDHLFPGKGVIVDHGLGFYSMYFHLSEILVQPGQAVTKGQVIGKVGATGRATGPHLHWGVSLNRARVNPYAFFKLPLEGR